TAGAVGVFLVRGIGDGPLRALCFVFRVSWPVGEAGDPNGQTPNTRHYFPPTTVNSAVEPAGLSTSILNSRRGRSGRSTRTVIRRRPGITLVVNSLVPAGAARSSTQKRIPSGDRGLIRTVPAAVAFISPWT